jgi:hypothetical protein
VSAVRCATLLALAACARRPGEAQCAAAWDHVGEVLFHDSQKGMPDVIDRIGAPPEVKEQMKEDMKKLGSAQTYEDLRKLQGANEFARRAQEAQIADCHTRMRQQDIQCTMAASTTEELVNKCGWKAGPGIRGGVSLSWP